MRRSTVCRYAMAAGCVAGAMLVEWVAWPWIAPALSPLFFVAVMFAAMLGGLGPGLLATALSAVATAFFFMPPAKSFEIGWDDTLRLGVFVVVAIVVSGTSEARRRAEAKLAAAKEAADCANSAKDHFLAILSHELRTPITPVLLTAGAMSRDADSPPHVREAMGLIHQHVEIQARLIDDLLDLTRIERGKFHLEFQSVDVHGLLRQVLRIVRADLEGKRLEFRLDLAAGRHHVSGDPARLQQVFWNLLKNAIKFTPPGGTIAVSTSIDSHRHLVVCVSDTGAGIEPRLLPVLCDPFEQGGETVARRFGGLGLGLSICKALVELHGGSIEAHSDGKDKGATVIVRLVNTLDDPPEVPRQDIVTATPRDEQPTQPARILLVEDDPVTAQVMSRLLTASGYHVRAADGVQAALNLASAEAFDLIISDLGLPDGSGLEIMRQLASRDNGSVPAIALSGHGMESDVQASRAAGFKLHLTKPVDLQRLESAIRDVCGKGPGGG